MWQPVTREGKRERPSTGMDVVDLAAFGRPVLAPDYVWFWYLAVGSTILKAQRSRRERAVPDKTMSSQRKSPTYTKQGEYAGICYRSTAYQD